MPSKQAIHPEALLHAVLDNVGVALLVIDSEGRFVFSNRAARKMLGSARSMNRLSLKSGGATTYSATATGDRFPRNRLPS